MKNAGALARKKAIRSRPFLQVLLFVLVLFVGYLDYATGEESVLTVVYLVPIALATWMLSRRAGALTGCAAVAIWFLVEQVEAKPYSQPFTRIWNTFELLALFMIAVYLLSALHEMQKRLEERVRARTAALTRSEDELRKALVDLERESAQRLNMLEQLRHADRLRAIGQLTAGVAHELGTPLNVAWARAHMIARGEVVGDEARDCAAIVEDQTQRMTTIIRRLLDFARPKVPDRTRADLRQILRQTVEILRVAASRHGVELVTEGDGQPAMADVDPGQIQQVLSNLVMNAIQAMPEGGQVTLDAHEERTRPPPEVGGSAELCWCLSVEDQGIGIPEQDLPRIFEPFFSTKDVGEGTGLGLSVSRGIVQEHGGWISVKSRPGQGTRFLVYLPQGAVPGRIAS